ncbi:MAG: DUF2807 domain-containing protein [Ferruginibacter sp.]|nr:DUF2807 domain-containing protein [Ferruginibacter sp.]
MKKLVLVILSSLALATAFPQQSSLEIVTINKMNIDEAVNSIKVYNQVEVLLQADSSSSIKIVGEKSSVEKIQVRFDKGHLTITGLEYNNQEKVMVFVPANHLQHIYIHGPATVNTDTTLSNTQLDVVINGTGTVAIHTTGIINQTTVEDYPINELPGKEKI